MTPNLYSFRRCPYAMRARLAIAISGPTVELREIILRDKPQTMLDISPKGTIPVLQLADGTVIEESLEIMDWALGKHDPDGWLTGDEAHREELVGLTTQNEGRFKRALDRYKYPGRYEDENVDPKEQRAIGLKVLQELDAMIGKKAFLFRETPTYTDMALLPFIRQFANTDRTWFDAQDISHVHRWLSAFLDSPLFLSIMTKYDKWQEGDAPVLFP